MKLLKILCIYLKGILHLPIYRIDVLEWAEHFYIGAYNCAGLCEALYSSFIDLNLPNLEYYTELQRYFPKYNRGNAQYFKEHYLSMRRSFWWVPGTWDENGRLGFFYWLKDQYEDDKTNLRKIK